LKLMRCPTCRAKMKGDEALEAPCRRCGSDLQGLRQCYLEATRYQQLARNSLQKEPKKSLHAAQKANQLVNNKETQKLLCVALFAVKQSHT